MKIYLLFLVLGVFGCQSNTEEVVTEKNNSPELMKKSLDSINIDEDEKRFRDSLYNRESENFISKLEEIPGRDSNAYKLTISSKDGKIKFTKILNTRPQRSMINYCTDMYTVVGYSCGGPCYTQFLVFTDQSRPTEQYSYGQRVSEHPNIIGHIKDEGFEKLFVRNLSNSKELTIDISDGHLINYGHMDTMYIVKNNLIIIYPSNKKQKKKIVNIESILN
jgi:hypothetical protein